MNRRVAFPFLTLSTDAVSAEPWLVSLNHGEPLPALDFLEDWDAASIVRVIRRFRIDLSRCGDDLEIDPAALRLRVLCRIGTGQGVLPRMILGSHAWPVVEDQPEITVDLDLPGQLLSARLHLRTTMMLETAPVAGDPLSPRQPGARLWSDEKDIRLEGQEQRFPMQIASFAELFRGRPQKDALWYLHWVPGEPSRDFGGAVRLYLNGDREDFVARVTSADPATLQTLLADVMSQLVERTLSGGHDEEALSACPPGSIGHQVLGWLKRACPGQTLGQVRSTLEFRTGDLRAALLAAAETGE